MDDVFGCRAGRVGDRLRCRAAFSGASCGKVIVRMMSRAYVFAATIVFAFSAATGEAMPASRVLTHVNGRGSQAIVITLIDVLPNGPVHILSSSLSAHLRHRVSHAEFEEMWNTLLANGAKVLHATGPAKTLD